jgi:hypothetical protein
MNQRATGAIGRHRGRNEKGGRIAAAALPIPNEAPP